MLQSMADVVRALNDLIERGIIKDYAIGGAIGALFWDEVTNTFDVDVFVLLAQDGAVIDLGPIYKWAEEHGYPQSHEHIKISGIPVQLVPAPDILSEEAIREAATLSVEGLAVRVIRPEYLIAMWLKPPANNKTRRERASRLSESAQLDKDRLAALLTKYDLSW